MFVSHALPPMLLELVRINPDRECWAQRIGPVAVDEDTLGAAASW
jgi:hypothetical protein